TELKMAVYVNSAAIILKIGIGTTAVVGGALFAGGEISLLTFFMFLMLVARLYDPMQITLQNFAAIISCGIQCERLDEVLSTETQTGEEKLEIDSFDIVFDHVGFKYSDDTDVLKDVSFTARQGQVTALIGPSGGGKTTISRLAARFWDTNEGTITLGGKDISKVDPETLLKNYSIVFQDVTLFNNSVMENIRIGREGATDEEVMEAARLANCEQFVNQLPEKYDTYIGENGSELSGGERQRISIARAFLKDAPVILLDEATASLDAENETAIQEALSRLIKNKTVMIIAHRMRTIANADHIVVLKDGVVAEQGSPEKLAGYDSIYSRMTKQQMISQNWKM
ncbi:MAG: ABC transporter ATP-binding protein/permease, partial [Lachnospiraceae bacterium]|nr:ABC transporter ATP-binding protein/permease [Lachnospiraceae bacterium]